jgi:hypothetical protein
MADRNVDAVEDQVVEDQGLDLTVQSSHKAFASIICRIGPANWQNRPSAVLGQDQAPSWGA